jgi:hypothetical protein
MAIIKITFTTLHYITFILHILALVYFKNLLKIHVLPC